MARKKQKPDLRRIRPTKTYTVEELAKALNRNVATVRRWIRNGLPTLDDARPALIDGEEVKTWLKTRWAKRKQPCRVDELYCCRCARPRRPLPGSVSITPNNEKTLTVRGICETCGARMRKLGALTKRAYFETGLRAFTQGKQGLYRCTNPNGTCTSHEAIPSVSSTHPSHCSKRDLLEGAPGPTLIPAKHREPSRTILLGAHDHE